MKKLSFGDVTVDRVIEAEGPGFFPNFIMPDSSDEMIAEERSWMEPNFFDAESGRLIMSVHSYVVRTPHHTILVDTCVGGGRPTR